jgi:hypothetical protein
VSERVKLTFASKAERKRVLKACKKFIPYGPDSTVMKNTLVYLADNIDSFAPSVTRGASEALAVPPSACQSPEVPCPDPAGARAPSTRQTDSKKDPSVDSRKSDHAAEIGAVIRECDWRQLKLPRSDTPESYAAQLLLTYPDVCTPGLIREAAMWVRNNPKKLANRKYLGGFLTNWCKNARKGPPVRASKHRDRDAVRAQTDWTKVRDDSAPLTDDPDDASFDLPRIDPRGRPIP